MRSALNNKSRVKNIKKQNARIPIRLTIKSICAARSLHTPERIERRYSCRRPQLSFCLLAHF